MAYQYLVEKLGDKIERTRSDVKKIANKISDHVFSSPDTTPSPEAVPGADSSSAIPPNPSRENFPLIEHWEPDAWIALRHSKKGSPLQGVDSINVQFWEDGTGGLIPPSRRSRVTRDLRSIWQDLLEKGKRLDCISKIGWEVREEYRTRIEALHPWLRLCDDHWKADQLWTNYFSGWIKGKGKQTVSLKREHSAEEGEDETGPSPKKLKTPAQPPAPPNPTKKPAAKVRPLFFTTPV